MVAPLFRARNLRRNETDAERILWRALRNRQLGDAKFRRQVRIGPFIADFACFERRLVVELDGGQHADAEHYDDGRVKSIQRQGYRVLRFWNNEVLENLPGLLEAIKMALGE